MSKRVKGQIYRAIILSTLLYGAETWTVYRRHVKKLHTFMMRLLRSNHEDQMARQSDKHKSSQAGRTPFYGRPPHQKESPLDRTSFEDANCPLSETGSLLAATRRTTTTWPPTSPLQRHLKKRDIDTNSWKSLALQRDTP